MWQCCKDLQGTIKDCIFSNTSDRLKYIVDAAEKLRPMKELIVLVKRILVKAYI